MTYIANLIAFLLALVLSISIHEFAHALVADLQGDRTARYMGRLTLNPVAHFDPLGAIMILFSSISGFGFGWGKPVQVNPRNLRAGPRMGMGIVAAAGPLSNVLLAMLFAIPLRLRIPLPGSLGVLLNTVVWVNISLAIFNLIPLFPLDGHSVLQGILSTVRAPWAYRWTGILDSLQAQGPILLLLFITMEQFLPFSILDPPRILLYRLITGF
ncbi:MAG: site-2 protease family protein [Chloroflexota bacterium]|nr:site-2 protease family protein [Chloroflexota bacterium]